MVVIVVALMLLNLAGAIACQYIARSRGQKVIFWTTKEIVFGIAAIPFVLRTKQVAV